MNLAARAGLITIEDVLEEIVGEIEDEFDDADAESGVYTLADGSHRVAGDANISAVNDAFAINLPEDEFDTIGGLIAHRAGRVPRRGETVECGGLSFNVMLTRGGAVPLVPRAARRTGDRPRRFGVNRPGPDGRGRGDAPMRLVMLVAGAVHALSFAPWPAWWLQILALAALAAAVADVRPSVAAWRAGCFSVGWLATGLWWLYISLHDFGGLAAPLSAAAVGLLAVLLSLYLAAAMALCARVARGSAVRRSLGFAAAWLGAELLRGQGFGGFPWIAAGYAHADGPLAPLAPWLGVYGIGAVSALLAATLAPLARGAWPGATPLLTAIALPAGAWLAPADFTAATGRLSVSLLQPAVPQDLKFDPGHLVANMAALQQQLHARARGPGGDA